MSRIFVALGLFLAASLGFAVPVRAQYNGPENQYNLPRQEGGGYLLPPPRPTPQPTFEPQDNKPSQGYQTNQGYQGGYGGYPGGSPLPPCPTCRVDVPTVSNLILARTVALQGHREELSVPRGSNTVQRSKQDNGTDLYTAHPQPGIVTVMRRGRSAHPASQLQAAVTAVCHWAAASARKARRVNRQMRWR
jgi:hypothetical protein